MKIYQPAIYKHDANKKYEAKLTATIKKSDKNSRDFVEFKFYIPEIRQEVKEFCSVFKVGDCLVFSHRGTGGLIAASLPDGIEFDFSCTAFIWLDQNPDTGKISIAVTPDGSRVGCVLGLDTYEIKSPMAMPMGINGISQDLPF